MSGAEEITATILDYLNEDCWRAILDYVPVKDIIRSERASSRWQRVMLVYLRGLRIGIEHPYPSLGSNELHRSVSWLLVRDLRRNISFENWTNKLGSSVTSTFCDTEKCLRIIGENCPNLEAVKFMDLPDHILRGSRNEHFRWLQRICFIKCPVSDRCVSEYSSSNALEELEIHHNQLVSGHCFTTIKPDLKSLVLNKCRGLRSWHLQRALERFCDLTKLVLNVCANHFDLTSNIASALSRLHKLEHLELYCQPVLRREYGGSNSALIESVCRLKHLKHLGGEIVFTDQQLDKVCRCCKELRYLDMEFCPGVTSHGVARMCRDTRLTALGFHNCQLSEDDILACVLACPDLTTLDVRRNNLSRGLIARVAAVRRRQRALRPLHFCIDNILLDLRMNGDLKYDQLILHF